MTRIPPARGIALDLLVSVLDRGRLLDDVLEDSRLDGLDDRDRAFVRLMLATCLRRLGQIDALIGACLTRPLGPRASLAIHALRLGVCQLVFLSVPPHAAISTSVDLVKHTPQAGFAGLINAVLRRLSREGAALAASQDEARLNTPDWLWHSWSAAYGEATTAAIARAHLGEAPIDLSVATDPQGWADRLEAEILPTGSLRRRAGGTVARLPGFAEGAWWVQDAAAALPARLLGDPRGRAVADLCAAPGGKTLQLATAGAVVTAVDRSSARLARLGDNLARLGLEATIVTADAATWTPERRFDAVLLDAPCSATGTLRRHPDVARHKGPADVAKLAATQTRLLDAAAGLVTPGGFLVYCVCSLEPEEGRDQIARLLASGAPWRREPVAPAEVGGLDDLLTPEGDLRTFPFHLGDRGGMDAFFAARLRRI